ncbi:MAG: hypothetical protein MUE71_06025 [Chitinophagaceae bacterium]|nr:hypothetical protein [Chitinophagaceae bacterium]MCU0405007.1 hypothetical protein [Chitinophagaceae bacterium]
MLDQLLAMVKDIGQEQVVNNSLIPNEQNETVMAAASETILSSFQQAIASGRGDELLGMFQSNSSAEIMANPLAQEIQDGFVANAQQKLGLNSNVIKGLAVTMIPIIISKLVKKTNSTAEADSAFNIQGLLGDLTGGGAQQGGLDIGSLIGQFTGGNQQGGGGIGGILQNLVGGQQSGGGQDMIGNLIKGFFGK